MVQKVTTIIPNDISAVEVTCRWKSCNTSIFLQPGKRPTRELKCPTCHKLMWTDDDPEYQLVVALSKFRRESNNDDAYATRLNIILKEDV